ncbi:unnamed protein product, partial [Prorocentrum cordatum]
TDRPCVLAFCAWARCSLDAPPEPAELGAHLEDYMNAEVLQGVKSWRGEKLMAGLMFFHPDYGRLGGLHLPRAMRCLEGWEMLSPSRSRKPLVSAIWAAMAVELRRLGAPLAGAMALIVAECYLRPGKMLGLTGKSFLAPNEHAVQSWVARLVPGSGTARSKDSGRRPWMSRILRALKDMGSSRPLLGLSSPQFLCLFQRAALDIGAD